MGRLKDQLLTSATMFSLLMLFHVEISIVNGNICIKKETCGECIAESPLCAWCWQKDLVDTDAPNCDIEENLRKRKCEDIVSPKSFMRYIKNQKLSSRGADENEAIQLKPQEIKIRLRPNTPHVFNVEFRQAVDYPIDLYYLMDLSRTMKDDKEKLASLGDKLADEMGTITRNFRLGFGSFVDKAVTPFSNSRPEKILEPCTGCAPLFGYRNNMPLSLDTKKFAKEVKRARISGNVDSPEGGFDAIMQSIVCKDEVAWRNNSRKILVYSSDDVFHYAGDGKLGGIITPNDEKCYLDKDGYYTKTTEMDYPSIAQITRQIRKEKINMIFAVTKDQVSTYEKLSRRLTSSSTGELDEDSANVVDLVRKQYDKITSAVEMTDDILGNGIQLTYYSTCLGTKKKETNICRDLKVESNVTFEVKLQYTSCPKDRSLWNRTFQIFPVGYQDVLTIHLEMLCECDCEKKGNEEQFSDKCSNGNGSFVCGVCKCYKKNYGKKCECDGTQTDMFLEDKACYKDNDTKACSGLGTCLCGQCRCYTRSNTEEKVTGKFCDCNNYSCDKKNGKFCSGKDHGTCECGKCKCNAGWIGDDCSCRDTNATCIGLDEKMCSGHGFCECGSCICEPEYFGKHCDDCSACPGKCNELRQCVECWLKNQNTGKLACADSCGDAYNVWPDENIEVKENEKQCTFEDEEECRFAFKYILDQENNPTIYFKPVKECPSPVDVVAIVAGVIGGIVATGLFLLMIWKVLTTVHDRRELAKFEKEKLMAKWQKVDNPIYKEPTSEFQNPAYRRH